VKTRLRTLAPGQFGVIRRGDELDRQPRANVWDPVILNVEVKVWFARIARMATATDLLSLLDVISGPDTDASLLEMREKTVLTTIVFDEHVVAGQSVLERIDPPGRTMVVAVAVLCTNDRAVSRGEDRLVEALTSSHD
jgi:hypothetical protein